MNATLRALQPMVPGDEEFYGDVYMAGSWHPSLGGITFWMESLCSAEKLPIHLTLEA